MESAPTAPALGRREQNKRDTQQAITDAALALARSHGLGNFTADQIAEQARVSRRTFFNYFHSAEEALTVSTESFLDVAVEQFALRPADEPVLDGMIAALAATTQTEDLGLQGELFRMGSGNPDLLRTQLLAWERAENRIIRAVQDRLGPAAGDLYVSALVGSVLSCARAAMQDWAAQEAPAAERTAADLEARMTRALSMLRDGFRSVS